MRIVILLLLSFTCGAQQLYSSWASTQVRHVVEIDKPAIKYDTIEVYMTMPIRRMIRNIFQYKDFRIEIIYYGKVDLQVYSGTTQVMLKPDDEYAILEKLIPITK